MKKVYILIITATILLANCLLICHAEEDMIVNLNIQSNDIVAIDFSIRTGQGLP